MAAANWNAKILPSSFDFKKADHNVGAGLSGTNWASKVFSFPNPINKAEVVNMALKRPLCNYSGVIKELAAADSLPGFLLYTRVNHTQGDSPVTLTNSDCLGFNTFTNTGASGEVILNLPIGVDGLNVEGIVTAAQSLTFSPNGSDAIRYQGTVGKAGGKITSNIVGNQLYLEWTGSFWEANLNGAWQLETS
jgi:hypothetical protein